MRPTNLKKSAERSAKLDRDLKAFIEAGGKIQEVPFGVLTQPAGFKRGRANSKTNGVPMRIVNDQRQPEHEWRSGMR